jgi:hypothetical protein
VRRYFRVSGSRTIGPCRNRLRVLAGSGDDHHARVGRLRPVQLSHVICRDLIFLPSPWLRRVSSHVRVELRRSPSCAVPNAQPRPAFLV